jgi:hypothetical protein
MIDEASAGSYGQEIFPAQFGAMIESSGVPPAAVPRSTTSPIENSP